MPLDGLAQVQFQSQAANFQEISNSWYLTKRSAGSPPDLATLNALAIDLVAYLKTTYLGMLMNSSTLQWVRVRQVKDPSVPGGDTIQEAAAFVGLPGVRTPGTAIGIPQEACTVIQFQSPFASRRFRGHNFMPPIALATELAGENVDSSKPYYVAVQAYVTQLGHGIDGAPTRWTGTELPGYSLACYSHRAQVLSLPSVAEVTNIGAPLRVHWLRSRNKGTI